MSFRHFDGLLARGRDGRVALRRIVGLPLVTSLMLAGVLGLWAGEASAKLVHPFVSSFGSFDNVQGLAVESSSGEVYVYDGGKASVYKFDVSGNPVNFTSTGTNAISVGYPGSVEGEVAVDSSSGPAKGDIYVAHADGSIEIFSAAGEKVGELTEEAGDPWGEACGVAVDSSGAVYVGLYPSHINKYVPSVNPVTNADYVSSIEGANSVCNVGVDSAGNAFADTWSNGPVTRYEASQFGALSASGSVVDEAGSTLAVDPANDEVYVDEKGRVAQFGPHGEPFGAPVSAFGGPGAGSIENSVGIAVSGFNGEVYVSDGEGAISVFGGAEYVPPVPVVEEQYAQDVTATSATLGGTLNPEGSATTYRFEYGTSTSYGTSTPEAEIGSGTTGEPVQAHIQGLQASAVYHYRLAATNGAGTAYGPDQTLTTQGVGSELSLLGGRHWEMVSPPHKHGAAFAPLVYGPVQSSARGDAFTDWATVPIEGEPAGATNGMYAFFARGSQGWSARNISLPHVSSTGPNVSSGQEYRFFSSDLSKAAVQPFGDFTPMSPAATESTPYLRTDYLNGNPLEQCTSECFTALVTAENVPSGTEFGGEPNGHCENTKSSQCGPGLLAATPDLSHFILHSNVALTSTPTGGEVTGGGLYEWGDGRLQLVSVLPVAEGGGAAPFIGLGAGENPKNLRHAISDDGSRVFWSTQTHLYMRDTVKEETIRLDLPQGSGEGGFGQYMAASSDGSHVFFISSAKLTSDSNATTEKEDLYEYDVNASIGSRLTDLSVDGHEGEVADVGSVIDTSEDGSYVYFTAAGRLAPGAASKGECGFQSRSERHLCNLYVRHNGVTKLIASLSQRDFPAWARDADMLVGRASPNGHWFVFMSDRNLTGYDTRDSATGQSDEEVYLYDAEHDRLSCASCNPTGGRPAGSEYFQSATERLYLISSGGAVWAHESRLSALVPPWQRYEIYDAIYQSRYLSDSGRTFFDSRDALVPQDVNGQWDVYEFEPVGIGDCERSAQTFSERSDGCVDLVSSGTSGSESAFLDASETGGDVFFLTESQLASEDFDNELDIYDAHECRTQAPCFATPAVSPPACDTSDSCKAAQSPQPESFGAPASQTFAGVGNVSSQSGAKTARRSLTRAQKLARALRACRAKHGSKHRLTCRRRARRRYGSGRARPSKRSTYDMSARSGR